MEICKIDHDGYDDEGIVDMEFDSSYMGNIWDACNKGICEKSH